MIERLFGEYEHSLDDKGRLLLPSPFRKVLPDNVVLTSGDAGELFLFDLDGFGAWKDSLFKKRDKDAEDKPEGYSEADRKQSRMRQFINRRSFPLKIDGAGRINVPEKLMRYANLSPSSKVVVIGDEDRIRIWEPSRLEDYEADRDYEGGYDLSAIYKD